MQINTCFFILFLFTLRVRMNILNRFRYNQPRRIHWTYQWVKVRICKLRSTSAIHVCFYLSKQCRYWQNVVFSSVSSLTSICYKICLRVSSKLRVMGQVFGHFSNSRFSRVIIFIPGQSAELQLFDSAAVPVQFFPFGAMGTEYTQVRVRWEVPGPHVTEHAP